ncbi:Ca-activated chloride channel family protein [Ruminiclostridium sufflavum DSM 19573]|uniref:Ca-activated chloride channel family protein n=1 Tax=Ruminiclostridium sufflavum DSM 19573 TaxID=1121337 RepID=A0A318XIQ1_9FIRM|nr:VWA domain-containing protein [Ruminiclostridium sufflavum]PYG86904.1 Ca-activated chloride channel family protein [Ruminiclostridium sufflavum DSM 19573]
MGNSKKTLKILGALAGISVIVFCLIYGGITLTKNMGKSAKVVSAENAAETLNELYQDITVNTVAARKAQISLEPADVKDSLPDISKFPPQVDNTTGKYIEIFSSTEKAGDEKDGWLVDVAKEFNAAGIQINGEKVSVRLRGIASGQGMDYIVSGKYLPDAFTPSNELWGEMMKSKGTNVSLVEKRLAGNVPGILLSRSKNDELIKKYGAINLKTITDAVAANEIAMGYTNPFASSTGLNFLISTLSTFDSKDLLSGKAIQGFEKFQTNIPFVAYTTLQMRESAKSGVLDGFILEYQTFVNTPGLSSEYIFTPFGLRHDSPMYSIGKLSDEKKEILNRFIEFCKSEKAQKLADDYGFNKLDDYIPEMTAVAGEVVSQAQSLWKEKKDANNDITAVFVADVSGSMNGVPLNNLKKSLLNGSQYILKDTSIGLVSFSTDVNINLPIAKFDINQRSLFTGAVTDLTANGSTAMFDAIVVATKMLVEEKAKTPNAKLMLFVLSDGETNYGHSLDDVGDMLKAFKIPIYTIGYNADIKALETLSQINEAASINADSEDVVYKLGSLFNAQM